MRLVAEVPGMAFGVSYADKVPLLVVDEASRREGAFGAIRFGQVQRGVASGRISSYTKRLNSHWSSSSWG